jgi:hypothetical protein
MDGGEGKRRRDHQPIRPITTDHNSVATIGA